MSDFKIVQLLNPIQINQTIRPMGVYSASTTYAVGDSVSYGNSSYIAIQATTGNTPTNTTYWQLLATAYTNKLTTTARNQTGVTIPKGSVVYFNGATGNLPLLALSQGNTELNSTKTVGITISSIANNASGEVCIMGLAESLDTSAFSVGVGLWLSPTVAGGMTTIKPSAPNHMVFIGTVTRSHPTDGTIEVKVQNGFELEELHNVAIGTLYDGQVLHYETSTGLWKNYTFTKNDIGLDQVQNLDMTNPANVPQDANHRMVTDVEKGYWNAKQDGLPTGLTGQYLRGDITWQTLDKNAVGLNNVPNVDATVASNIVEDSTHRFVTDSEKTTWNAKLDTTTYAQVGNKDLNYNSVYFTSSGNGYVQLNPSGSTGNSKSELIFNNNVPRYYTFPNNTGTVALTSDVSSSISSALTSYVQKVGDTMTGPLEVNGTTGNFSGVLVGNSDTSGTAQLTCGNGTTNIAVIGATGSTFTNPLAGSNQGFFYSLNGWYAISNDTDGFNFIQNGINVASVKNSKFTAIEIDALPVNFMALSSVTPTINDTVMIYSSSSTSNAKTSLSQMPVSAPQNLNSIVNAIIFG